MKVKRFDIFINGMCQSWVDHSHLILIIVTIFYLFHDLWPVYVFVKSWKKISWRIWFRIAAKTFSIPIIINILIKKSWKFVFCMVFLLRSMIIIGIIILIITVWLITSFNIFFFLLDLIFIQTLFCANELIWNLLFGLFKKVDKSC